MAPGGLTVVGFASGSPMSVRAMQGVARGHRLAAVVVPPRPPRGMLSRLRAAVLARPPDPLEGLGVPLVGMHEVARYAPDAILVASFPRRIPAATLACARLGAFNVHMSLLPRHRGADPLFSTYWDDDREAGVSVHWMEGGIDAGPLAAQQSLRLPRGMASRELYSQLAERGAQLAEGVLAQLAQGGVERRPQAASQATARSLADIAALRIPLHAWGGERTWHVLAGLGDQRHGLLAQADGRVVAHGRARGWRAASDAIPGRIERGAQGLEVHCRDAIVDVDAP